MLQLYAPDAVLPRSGATTTSGAATADTGIDLEAPAVGPAVNALGPPTLRMLPPSWGPTDINPAQVDAPPFQITAATEVSLSQLPDLLDIHFDAEPAPEAAPAQPAPTQPAPSEAAAQPVQIEAAAADAPVGIEWTGPVSGRTWISFPDGTWRFTSPPIVAPAVVTSEITAAPAAADAAHAAAAAQAL